MTRSRFRDAVALATCISSVAYGANGDDWLGPDKALHFGATALIATGSYGLSSIVVERPMARLAIGFGTAMAAGAVKEAIDLSGVGSASWKDLTWDLAGATTGALLSYLVDRLVCDALRSTPDKKALIQYYRGSSWVSVSLPVSASGKGAVTSIGTGFAW